MQGKFECSIVSWGFSFRWTSVSSPCIRGFQMTTRVVAKDSICGDNWSAPWYPSVNQWKQSGYIAVNMMTWYNNKHMYQYMTSTSKSRNSLHTRSPFPLPLRKPPPLPAKWQLCTWYWHEAPSNQHLPLHLLRCWGGQVFRLEMSRTVTTEKPIDSFFIPAERSFYSNLHLSDG